MQYSILQRPFNLDKLVLAIAKRSRNNNKICINCLNYIDRRYTTMDTHYKNCKRSKGTVTKYAKEGEVKQFAQQHLQVEAPFYIVADFEASNSTDFEADSTGCNHIETKHKINSYCFYLHINDNLDKFPYNEFQNRLFTDCVTDDTDDSEKKLTAKFIKEINKIAEKLLEWRQNIDTEQQLQVLKNEYETEFEENNVCFYCK